MNVLIFLSILSINFKAFCSSQEPHPSRFRDEIETLSIPSSSLSPEEINNSIRKLLNSHNSTDHLAVATFFMNEILIGRGNEDYPERVYDICRHISSSSLSPHKDKQASREILSKVTSHITGLPIKKHVVIVKDSSRCFYVRFLFGL